MRRKKQAYSVSVSVTWRLCQKCEKCYYQTSREEYSPYCEPCRPPKEKPVINGEGYY